jgi:hypothetical protein
VNDYNNAIGMFPLSIVANSAGMQPHAYFEAAADSRQNPGVNMASSQANA